MYLMYLLNIIKIFKTFLLCAMFILYFSIIPQSLATEYGPVVELTKRYGDLISWKTPFNINLTELYHRQNIR